MVLTPLTTFEIKNIFDETAIKVLKFSLAKSMLGQPEPLKKQKKIPYQIAKEHIEQWMVQALEVKPVGSGSYPIDIYNEKDFWGADVKMLSCKVDTKGNLKDEDSGETSLAQNFKGSGSSLDQQFKDKNYQFALNNWLKIVYDKLKSIEKDYILNEIYYFFFLRADMSFYLAGFKVNKEKIMNVLIDEKRISDKSIFTKNYIDEKYGNVKLYKSKKRLELRLKPQGLFLNGNLLHIMNLKHLDGINLRVLIGDLEKSKEYIQIQSEKHIFNNLD